MLWSLQLLCPSVFEDPVCFPAMPKNLSALAQRGELFETKTPAVPMAQTEPALVIGGGCDKKG